MYVFGRAVERLLVGYHELEQHQQRMEREPQQRQRQHQRQDQHQLRVARAQPKMMALLTLFYSRSQTLFGNAFSNAPRCGTQSVPE